MSRLPLSKIGDSDFRLGDYASDGPKSVPSKIRTEMRRAGWFDEMPKRPKAKHEKRPPKKNIYNPAQ